MKSCYIFFEEDITSNPNKHIKSIFDLYEYHNL